MMTLPIDSEITKIQKLILQHPTLILLAEPGAGKTTRVPAALSQIFKKKILVLEPRRLAAVSAAARIGEEQNWKMGDKIGYQVRFEKKCSDQTQVIFMTEALLLRRLLSDPQLKDVDCVILDEFHERSLHTDVALGSLRELQELDRPDLKIVIMSATLDPEPLKKFTLNAAEISVPGKTFPLEDFYDNQTQSINTDFRFVEKVLEKIKSPQVTSRGNVLVFLPGVSEVERSAEACSGQAALSAYDIFKLHGSLTLEEQQRVLAPNSKRKLIFSTNIAESSLTIDGVDTVIDSGLARVPTFHPTTQVTAIETKRISLWNAKQRAGRSHRQAAGHYYRMWSKIDERSMQEQPEPEVLRADLSETLLLLSRMGVRDFKNFSWFTIPKVESLEAAEQNLKSLQLLSPKNEITELGKKAAALPLPPRLGCLFEISKNLGVEKLGAHICAALSESARSSRRKEAPSGMESDLKKMILQIENNPKSTQRKISDQLSNKNFTEKDFNYLDEILMLGFSYQICRRRKADQKSSIRRDGKGILLADESDVQKAEFFIALQMLERGKADLLANMAHGLSLEKIEARFKNEIKDTQDLTLNEDRMELQIGLCRSLGRMPLGEIRYRPPKSSEVESELPKLCVEHWDWICRQNQTLQRFWTRLNYYCQETNQESPLNSTVLQSVAEQACFGESSLQKVLEKDWIYFLRAEISANFLQQWQSECPESLKSPSGRSFEIQYDLGRAPYVEIKIQHAFGIHKNVPILGGKHLLNFHLLAPNGRPAQMTSDIEGFWKNSYPEIRKELKGRYPKHDWPEF